MAAKAKLNPTPVHKKDSVDGSENNDKQTVAWGKESEVISEAKKSGTDMDFEIMSV